jgi:hypothetical protein
MMAVSDYADKVTTKGLEKCVMEENGSGSVMLYLKDSEVVYLETGFAIFYLIDEKVILVEVRNGVFVDRKIVKHHLNLLERLIGKNYGIVDNRKNDFSHDIVEIYEEFHSRVRLKKVAVVTHRNQTKLISKIEGQLCQKDFAVFDDVESAIRWAKEIP